MKKVLMLADSPTCITGFGNVARHIAKTLQDTGEYHITIVGINYDGFPPHKFPYDIIPATSAIVERYNDLYGRKKTFDLLASGQFDLFFCIQDMGVTATFMPEVVKLQMKLPKEKRFVTILYTPVDSGLSTHIQWIQDGVATFDYPVTYTNYGRREILKHINIKNLGICGHGADINEFYPLPKEAVEQFKAHCIANLDLRNRFIVLNVNRNQIRKDYLKTFLTFAEVKKHIPCAFLFVLAQIKDQGGDLIEIANQCGLEFGKDWVAPADYNAAHGYGVDAINAIYNIADVVFSSTVGEGWGLSSVEAMAVGKPCVFPDNTSLSEIFGNGERGYLVPCGDTPDRHICYGAMDSSLVRPTIDVMTAAKYIKRVFDNPKEAQQKAAKARDWVYSNTWDAVNQFWVEKFAEAATELERRRNDPDLEEKRPSGPGVSPS